MIGLPPQLKNYITTLPDSPHPEKQEIKYITKNLIHHIIRG